MAILPIYTYNQPILDQETEQVEEMTDELSEFIDSMFETMDAAKGVGLAANQVGRSLAITVIDIAGYDEDEDAAEQSAAENNGTSQKMVLINPVIEYFSENQVEFEEGCLSLPNFRDDVLRPDKIRVRFKDRDMNEQVLETDGLLARVIQHEVDHLNGIYFFERLTPLRRAKAHNILKRIQRGAEPADYPVKPFAPVQPRNKKRKK